MCVFPPTFCRLVSGERTVHGELDRALDENYGKAEAMVVFMDELADGTTKTAMPRPPRTAKNPAKNDLGCRCTDCSAISW